MGGDAQAWPQDVLGAEDVAERSVGPTVRTSLTLLSSPSQKCLTASPRTCGGASSPAAMTVSHGHSWCVPSHPSLRAGRPPPPPPASHLAELLGTLKMPTIAYMQAAPAPLLKIGSVPCSRQPLRACHEGMAPPCHVIWDNAPNIATKRVLVRPAPQGEGRTELRGTRPASW